jgi:ABC-type Fe3+/spermidine/putrescine transport system ATPase subunit
MRKPSRNRRCNRQTMTKEIHPMATLESIEKRRVAALARLKTSAAALAQRFDIPAAELLSVPMRQRDRALREALQLEALADVYDQIATAITVDV